MSSFRVILKPRRALPFFSRHPWVFAGAVASVEADGSSVDQQSVEPGATVAVHSSGGEFIAWGLYNSQSNLRVRLYSWQESNCIDAELIASRIDAAITLRRRLFSFDAHTGCRLIFSEADGLSGLTVDRYGEWLLVQFTGRGLYRFSESIIATLSDRLTPAGIRLRTERGIGEAEGLDLSDQLLAGSDPPRPLFIRENGVQFGVDVVEGQKTGFFLDQRDNRAIVANLCRDRRVLDAFCYSGAFGITALVNGHAGSVIGVDSSESALRLARANAELNGVADRCRFEQSSVADALDRLRSAREMFGVVVLDPPKMARSRRGVERALKGYFKLNRRAVDLLEPGGILATFSCSGHVAEDDFLGMLLSVAKDSGRNIRILRRPGLPPDHPVSIHCPENDYLCGAVCHVE